MSVKHYTLKLTVIEENGSGEVDEEDITETELSEIAANLSAKELKSIARSYLKYAVKKSCSDQTEFNFNLALLKNWLNRNRGKSSSSREVFY